jgi:hypothetical protein
VLESGDLLPGDPSKRAELALAECQQAELAGYCEPLHEIPGSDPSITLLLVCVRERLGRLQLSHDAESSRAAHLVDPRASWGPSRSTRRTPAGRGNGEGQGRNAAEPDPSSGGAPASRVGVRAGGPRLPGDDVAAAPGLEGNKAPEGTSCPSTGAPAIAIARDRRSAAGPVADGLAVVGPVSRDRPGDRSPVRLDSECRPLQARFRMNVRRDPHKGLVHQIPAWAVELSTNHPICRPKCGEPPSLPRWGGRLPGLARPSATPERPTACSERSPPS